MIPYIAFGLRILRPPLFGGHTEQGEIQNISFGRINQPGRFALCQPGRNQRFFDGICMHRVSDFGEYPFEIPVQRILPVLQLLFFQPLKLLDKVQLEYRVEPGAELEGNILMGIGSAIASGFGSNADSTGTFHPAFGRQHEGTETGLISNPLKFEGIKIRVVQRFPHAQKLNDVSVPQPVADNLVCSFTIRFLGNIGGGK